MEVLLIFWLIINVIGSLLMILDKHNAICKKKRISEKTLILISCFGGALFMWISMYLIHHKTKHLKFVIGVPVILFCQIGIFLYYLLR